MKLRSKHGGGRVGPGVTLLLVALTALLLCPSAVAQRMQGSGHAQWHGNTSGSHPFDRGAANSRGVHQPNGAGWRGGRWFHGHHHGNSGWWWVNGGLWYWYPVPVYAYPYESSLALTSAAPDMPPPPPPTWYYCEASGTYYPDVTTCPGGWVEVPAGPGQALPVPQQ